MQLHSSYIEQMTSEHVFLQPDSRRINNP